MSLLKKKHKETKPNPILDKVRKKISDIRAHKNIFWECPTSKSLIRVLSWKEDEPFYFEVKGHFIPWGGERGKGILLLCLETIGKPCLGCKKSEELLDSSNAEEREMGKRLRANSRYFYNIIDLAKPEEGVQVWANYSEEILSTLLGWYSDPDIGDFTDPVQGRNIIITKTDAKPPRYKIEYKPKLTAIQNKQWLKQVKDLRKFAPPANPQEMKKLLSEISITSDDDSDRVVKKPTGAKKQKLIDSLECFSREYKKLDTCPTCPVRRDCKVMYKKRRLERAKKKASKFGKVS